MCDCIETTNKALEAMNAGLDVPLRINLQTGQFQEPTIVVPTYKLDTKKRGKPPVVFASYCPFCGEKYECDTERPAEPEQAPLLPPE